MATGVRLKAAFSRSFRSRSDIGRSPAFGRELWEVVGVHPLGVRDLVDDTLPEGAASSVPAVDASAAFVLCQDKERPACEPGYELAMGSLLRALREVGGIDVDGPQGPALIKDLPNVVRGGAKLPDAELKLQPLLDLLGLHSGHNVGGDTSHDARRSPHRGRGTVQRVRVHDRVGTQGDESGDPHVVVISEGFLELRDGVEVLLRHGLGRPVVLLGDVQPPQVRHALAFEDLGDVTKPFPADLRNFLLTHRCPRVFPGPP